MKKNLTTIARYLACFTLGIVFTFAVMPVLRLFSELLFGTEIQSLASFPPNHMARLYSRPGGGDQTFLLVVDGKTVYFSGDAESGDLNEKLSWDTTGKIVTLEIDGEKVFTYNIEAEAR